MSETATAPTKESRPPEQDRKYCPRCHFDQAQQVIQVSEDDKKEYVRCLLGKRQFAKKYQLCDGQLVLTFRSLRTDVSERLSVILADTHEQDMMTRATDSIKLKLVFYLVELNKQAFTPYYETEDGQAVAPYEKSKIQQYFADTVGKESEDLAGLCIAALMEFSRLTSLLAANALDRNFWKGAGYL